MALIKSCNNKEPKFGDDCWFAENSTIIGDVTMGDHCSVWFSAVIRGDVNSISIGNKVNIQDGAVIHCTYQKAKTTIGNNVSIGHNALVHGCTIDDNVLIGMGSIVMDNCHVVHSLEEGIAIAQKENQDELFVIGGAQVYALALPLADKLYLTEIDAAIEGDTYFPDYDKKNWREISRTHHPADSRHTFPFDFVIYEKTNN